MTKIRHEVTTIYPSPGRTAIPFRFPGQPGRALAALAVIIMASLALASPGFSAPQATSKKNPETRSANLEADKELESLLISQLEEQEIPAMFAAIYQVGKPLRIAAVGVRKWGSKKQVTIHDQVHIGSNTKAVTATLIGKLVEQKKLAWDSTIAEILPELSQKIHEGYRTATLEQLLTHRSGVAANAKNWWLQEGNTVSEKRFNIAIDSLGSAPTHTPGTRYLYSNLGYMLAGLMAEKVAGKDWESLVRKHIFETLEMRSAGFGPPGRSGKLDQPWGHVDGKKKFIPQQRDNSPALGPAGTIHLSLEDWAKFGAIHLGNLPNPIVSIETIKRLHQRPPESKSFYAMGWSTIGNRGTVTHNGSNTMWYATIRVSPETDTVYLAACNSGNAKAIKAVENVIQQLIKLNR